MCGQMIQVDISNIWGAASLPDLLALEAEVSAAHKALAEENWARFRPEHSAGEVHRITEAAEMIRSDSEVLVVIANEDALSGPRGVVELLQGPDRNLIRRPGEPQIFFAGNSLSTHRWQELTGLLAGKDFSLCVISEPGDGPAQALAFRELKWLLERRYGTDEARRRIYIAAGEESALGLMAEAEDWELFVIPENGSGTGSVLSPAGLLPMAVAGIDIAAVLRGAGQAREELDLRSYENPAWLYAACRRLLGRKGKRIELLESPEPGFAGLGAWWQRLFPDGEIFPVWAGPIEGKHLIHGGEMLATLLRFAAPEQKVRIREDVKDLGGVNCLAGRTLDQVEEIAFQERMDACVDEGTGVICVDCGQLGPQTVGQLLYFLLLSRALYGGMRGAETGGK